jgi:uncharacterized protein YihD (DUF1040 family)
VRNPERIHQLMSELEKLWQKNPDLRFGQLVCNFASLFNDGDVTKMFYREDDATLEQIRKWGER